MLGRTARSAALVIGGFLACEGIARAYDKDAVDALGWRYELQPYATIPLAVTGNATVVDRSVPVDVTAGDIFKKLRLAGDLRFEAWNGPWGVVLDGAFVRLADSKSRPDLTFDLTTRAWVGEALGAYRFGWWHGAERQPSFSTDVMLGAHLAHLSETLDIDALSRTASATFWKGLAEVRPILRISPSWAVIGRFLVGAPDFSLSTGGAVEYDVSRVAIRLGWGYDKLKYSSSTRRLDLDVSMNGPFVALGIRFGAGPIF